MKIKVLRTMVRIKNARWFIFLLDYFKDVYLKTTRTNEQLKQQLLQFIPFLLASSLTGLAAFLYSNLFELAEELSASIYEANPAYLFLLTPLCFLASWWLVKKTAPFAKGSGIPQVMASLDLAKPRRSKLISHFLSLRIIIVKVISSLFKVLGGGVLGREGPTIQIASSIFYVVEKRLPAWWLHVSQKNMLIAGAASGLAAAFNTPLGGIIFAIEELSQFHIKYYKSPLFIAVIISGLVAQGLGGSYLYLGTPRLDVSGFEVFLAVIVVSVLCGYFGSKMCYVMRRTMNFFRTFSNQKWEVGIILLSAILMATAIFFLGTDVMGSGKQIMTRTLFTEDKTVAIYLPFARMAGLITSFSFGGAGGIFAPSLSAGAAFGALTAQVFDLAGGNADLLILVGMAGFLTSVTRTPFTSAIIIFEMTDRHSIIFMLLIGSIIANVISSLVEEKSFYDHLRDDYLAEIK